MAALRKYLLLWVILVVLLLSVFIVLIFVCLNRWIRRQGKLVLGLDQRRASAPETYSKPNRRPLQTPALQTSTRQTPALQTSTRQTPALQTSTRQTPALQTSTRQTPALQTSTRQTPALQTSTRQTPARQTPALQTSTRQTSTLQTSARQTSTPPLPPRTQFITQVPESPSYENLAEEPVKRSVKNPVAEGPYEVPEEELGGGVQRWSQPDYLQVESGPDPGSDEDYDDIDVEDEDYDDVG